MTDLDALDDGTVVDVEWRVLSTGNSALQPYYIHEMVMFVHTFEDTGERALLLEQDWLDRQPEERREYARSFADGTPLNIDHPHLETVEVKD